MIMNEYMNRKMEETCNKINDPLLETIYRNCFRNTWETTLNMEEDGKTYIITGDIEAMWLRDSSLQVMPYLNLTQNPEVKRMFQGLIEKQAIQMITDPYANAFNKDGDWSCWSQDNTEMGPFIWERKYEVDSLAFPLYLLTEYYQKTRDQTVFTNSVFLAIEKILDTWTIEQNHGELSEYRFERDSNLVTETLQNQGKGTPVAYTGMTWSGFRPSDDACMYHYLIPSNMLAVCVLQRLAKLTNARIDTARAQQLAEHIKEGILRHGVVDHEEFGPIFAYEVDGLGNYNLMDDANLPSLLSAAYFGFCGPDDFIYRNTRNFVLSEKNPYYYSGTCAKGVGSPHTPANYIWPIAIAMQGLSAVDKVEKWQMIQQLMETHAGTNYMHEGFDVDHPANFTRPWFAWANSMFCLLVNDYYDIK
jgi:meiotically up-regulated gene 157 (Mug157) protein